MNHRNLFSDGSLRADSTSMTERIGWWMGANGHDDPARARRSNPAPHYV